MLYVGVSHMVQKKAVVLLSGGLDSATCLYVAQSKGFSCHALVFDYGQRHRAEIEAAQALARSVGAQYHVLPIPVDHLQCSALTDQSSDIPAFGETKGIPSTYVPARNTIFLSLALGLAESVAAQDIFIGVSAIDYSGYPDCRPEFIAAFQALAGLATKAAVEGAPPQIHTPLQHLSKAETIRLGDTLGLDYAMTVSCYAADAEGRACGRCDSCAYRRRGFEAAGLADPTRYQPTASDI